MTCNEQSTIGPLVSVVLPTFNRPRYLAYALQSVLRQSYDNLQVIVVRDGGEDVADIVNSFNDPRIEFIDRGENRGKAHSLNEGLARARGEYIAYIDDDDVFYPRHVETLVSALEGRAEYGAAYSDLYKVFCRIEPDGSRTALSKVVDVSRDFDRMLMLYFNHVLHVSLMHRRDLLDRTGLYNEELNVLIDWDMTRRLAFYTDFIHIPEITGEFYYPVDDSERISVRRRQDKREYIRNVLTIRATRPPKPWPKVADLAIVLTAHRLNRQAGETIGLIWQHTFYPYKLYLPLADPAPILACESSGRAQDLSSTGGAPSAAAGNRNWGGARLETDMPNIVPIPTDMTATDVKRVSRILLQVDAEYVAVVPVGFAVGDLWVEDSLYALTNSADDVQAFELEGSDERLWAVVLKTDVLRRAVRKSSAGTIRDALAGVQIRRILPDEIPFQFDTLLGRAEQAGRNGDCKRAAAIYEHIADNYENQLWMRSLAANALFHLEDRAKAADLLLAINRARPTVGTLLLEAKIKRENHDPYAAIRLLKQAEQILVGPVWQSRKSAGRLTAGHLPVDTEARAAANEFSQKL